MRHSHPSMAHKNAVTGMKRICDCGCGEPAPYAIKVGDKWLDPACVARLKAAVAHARAKQSRSNTDASEIRRMIKTNGVNDKRYLSEIADVS